VIRRRTRRDVLRDREVLEVLRDQPELLAIADAIHATLGHDYRRQRRRRRIARTGTLTAAVTVAAVLALVQPWSGGGPGLVTQALAAIPGRGPIVHAVIRSDLPGVEIVNLQSGRSEPEQVTSEFWYDPTRDLLHTVIRRDGVVVTDILATPEKTASATGPVFGGAAPTLDPALLAFASGYRQALASGAARPLGRALAGNRTPPVLRLTTRLGREQVTLDPKTLRPRTIRALRPNGEPSPQIAHVITLSALSSRAANFHAKRRTGKPFASAGAVMESTAIAPTRARHALSLPPLWAGNRLAGLRLRLLARQRLSRIFPTGTTTARAGSGVDLIYGALRGGRPDWRSHFLEIQEAPTPEPAYGLLPGPLRVEPLPKPGLLQLEREQPAGRGGGHTIWRGELHQAGLYLVLTGSSRGLVLRAARSLRAIPSA
jgi:hypothetical protein